MHLIIFRPWATFASSRSFTCNHAWCFPSECLDSNLICLSHSLEPIKSYPFFLVYYLSLVLLVNLTTGSVPITCAAHSLPGDFYSLYPLIKMHQPLYILLPIVRLIFLSSFIVLLKNLCSVFLGGMWSFSWFNSIYNNNLCCYRHFSFSQTNIPLSHKIVMKYVAYMSPFFPLSLSFWICLQHSQPWFRSIGLLVFSASSQFPFSVPYY